MQPNTRKARTTTPTIQNNKCVVTPAIVGQALAALTESSVAREFIGRKNAKRDNGKRDFDGKNRAGSSRVDCPVELEERQHRRSARLLRRRVPVQRPRTWIGVYRQEAISGILRENTGALSRQIAAG